MKNEVNNKLLTKEQIEVVETMIVDSMKTGFLNSNNPLPSNFYEMTGKIASDITHKVQMELGKKAVFKKILDKEAKKPAKKVVKKKK